MGGGLKRWAAPEAGPPLGLYSHAVEIPPGARVLYIAGQVGSGPDGVMREGFEAQFVQMWENLLAHLQAAGMDSADLVNVNTYLLDEADLPAFRALRTRFIPDPPPASTVLIVKALAKPDWLVEIDAVAARLPSPESAR